MEHGQTSAPEHHSKSRNPFGVMDVPDPYDREVIEFAANATLSGSAGDENASEWPAEENAAWSDVIEGSWASRWNGGADPTIPGDTPDKWKQGRGEVKMVGERVYLYFDWDGGARQGLIDARREGATRLVGKYINLTSPAIRRPWIGLIVNNRRIDGRWTGGRLDFRR